MNYKLLFPSYRNRYLFIRNSLRQLSQERQFSLALNLGTGEGDYDQMLARYCGKLTACDINEGDIAYAKALNQNVPNLEYRVENALDLSFADNTFDLIVSVDVIEHVGQPERMIEEVQRVLKPDGIALITFPCQEYPITYDPINRLLSWLGKYKIPQGAYAFGHEYLISKVEFRDWSERHRFSVLRERNLSGYIVALLEMYWTGMLQRLLKANSTNLSEAKEKKLALRPTTREPLLARLTDAIIAVDHFLFGKAAHSIGKGFIIQKKH